MSSMSLFRLSGLAGIISGLAFVIDTLLIDTFLPANVGANVVGFLTPLLGLLALTGLYLWQREVSGHLGVIGYVVNFIGLALLLTVVFANNFIFSALSKETLQALFTGPTRTALVTVGLIYLVGAVLFGLAIIKAGVFSRTAAILYIIGSGPVALMPLFPELVVAAGSVMVGLGIAWFGYSLWANSATATSVAYQA